MNPMYLPQIRVSEGGEGTKRTQEQMTKLWGRAGASRGGASFPMQRKPPQTGRDLATPRPN